MDQSEIENKTTWLNAAAGFVGLVVEVGLVLFGLFWAFNGEYAHGTFNVALVILINVVKIQRQAS